MFRTCIWYHLLRSCANAAEYEEGNGPEETSIPGVNMGGQGDRPHRGQQEIAATDRYLTAP